MAHSALNEAKKNKNDEFYTQLTDIEKELRHYKDQFKGKIIFCNCDDPRESNFFKYFALNFEYLGLKKLIATHYVYTDLFKPWMSYKLEIEQWLDLNNDGKINLEDVRMTPLKENGDFRSEECIELLKEADIVCTNPPFSLFREYVSLLMKYEKKFLIIGNDNAIKYKEFFPLLKNNKVWLWYGKVKEFKQPDGTIKQFWNVGWYTNLDVAKRHENIILYKSYNEIEFLKYDHYNAINVDKVSNIPQDYYWEMWVPITFLDKHNPEQFEIVDALNRYSLLDIQNTNEEVRKIGIIKEVGG